MSFQAYLDTIKAKTGKTPNDFKKLAEQKGLLQPGMKAGPIVAWLKEEFALGHGHAMAVYAALQASQSPAVSKDGAIDKHFSGGKSGWRDTFDRLVAGVGEGGEVGIAPTGTYLSLLRGKKKFAVVQVTKDRMDIGIKLKEVAATGRFQLSGSWNAMVTHRVQLDAPEELDAEVFAWLRDAYQKA